MTPEELRHEVEKFRFWYHKIDLGGGVITPGLDLDSLWDMIRDTRNAIDYKGKKVLDIASFDGMWAFEAEKLGAEMVVATDCYYETFKNFLFCRQVLRSNVIPYYNISPYNLHDRLDVYLQENWEQQKPYDRLFDIVQHLGLLYHLRDPMLTLSQARSVLRTGGHLLLETAAVINAPGSFMLFNGVPGRTPGKPRIYEDTTTWWAPTVECLKEMLMASLFEPIEGTVHSLDKVTEPGLMAKVKSGVRLALKAANKGKFRISRVCLVARAIGPSDADKEYFRELSRAYRNPGLATDHL
jgi:tRNA (mo5U34)-methyltransferase